MPPSESEKQKLEEVERLLEQEKAKNQHTMLEDFLHDVFLVFEGHEIEKPRPTKDGDKGHDKTSTGPRPTSNTSITPCIFAIGTILTKSISATSAR